MQGVEDVLLMPIAALMSGKHLSLVQNLEAKGIDAQGQHPTAFRYRNTVAVGLENDLAVGGQRDLHRFAARIILLRQWQQRCFLRLSLFSNTARLPMYGACLVGQALRTQVNIQFRKRSDFWQ